MQPRLSTSKKWTALPRELTTQMQTVLTESFRAKLDAGTITADGRIYPDEILIVVGLKAPKRLRQAGWEISIAYDQRKDNVLKLLHLGMDAAGALFEQIFAVEDDSEFPRLWQRVEFEKREIYVQYTTVNPDLESEANRLLGVSEGEELIGGDWDEDVGPEHIKATLGLADDDEGQDEE